MKNIFQDCYVTQQVLRQMEIATAPIHANMSLKQRLVETFNSNNTSHRASLAISFWAIWHNRNKFYHEGVRQNINKTMSFFKAYIAELNMLNNILENKQNRQVVL